MPMQTSKCSKKAKPSTTKFLDRENTFAMSGEIHAAKVVRRYRVVANENTK